LTVKVVPVATVMVEPFGALTLRVGGIMRPPPAWEVWARDRSPAVEPMAVIVVDREVEDVMSTEP
jgi:hypothetical protein